MNRSTTLLPLAMVALLGGCVTMPSGPSVMVLPGTSKSFDQFRVDEGVCRQYAGETVGMTNAGQAAADSATASAVAGTVIGAAAGAAIGAASGQAGPGAAIGAGTGLLFGSVAGSNAAGASYYAVQRRYDAAYMQCMYARGNRVPVRANYRAPYPGYAPPLAYYPPPSAARAPAPRWERYTLSAQELFAFDRDDLRMPQSKLDEIASALVSSPQIKTVTITGYTDRIGSDAYNLELSQRRADAVKAYLVGKGVAASHLIASGKGKTNPVVQCEDSNRSALIKCLEPNRRVEVEQITVERRPSY